MKREIAVAVASLVLAGGSDALAQSGTDSAQVPARPGNSLDIRVAASRNQSTAGGTIGIVAYLSNKGDSTIYIKEQSVVLVFPPELVASVDEPQGVMGVFPTEAFDTIASSVLAIAPGEHAEIVWSSRAQGRAKTDRLPVWMHTVSDELKFLFFSPGDYQLTVEAKYWTNAGLPRYGYHLAAEPLVVRVMAPETVILFGAAIGGLIAYAVLPSRRTEAATKTKSASGGSVTVRMTRVVRRVSRSFASGGPAMLWSAIATILLARLSQTPFLIQVTVTDFWGAIAMGFLAQLAGSKGIERLVAQPRDTHNPHAPGARPMPDSEAATEAVG